MADDGAEGTELTAAQLTPQLPPEADRVKLAGLSRQHGLPQ